GAANSAFGSLVLRRVTTPAGAPTLSANLPLAVAATTLPVLVPHLGNTAGASGQLAGGDDRLASVSLRAGHLWAAHAIGVNESGTAGSTRNGVRWYDIGAVDTAPA